LHFHIVPDALETPLWSIASDKLSSGPYTVPEQALPHADAVLSPGDQLRRPLCGMQSAARAWHHTMSAYLKSQGCTLVGFERSMWTVVKQGHVILITAHIDDFIIACADRQVLDEFRTALLQRFEGTYEGEVHTYLGCEST